MWRLQIPAANKNKMKKMQIQRIKAHRFNLGILLFEHCLLRLQHLYARNLRETRTAANYSLEKLQFALVSAFSQPIETRRSGQTTDDKSANLSNLLRFLLSTRFFIFDQLHCFRQLLIRLQNATEPEGNRTSHICKLLSQVVLFSFVHF